MTERPGDNRSTDSEPIDPEPTIELPAGVIAALRDPVVTDPALVDAQVAAALAALPAPVVDLAGRRRTARVLSIAATSLVVIGSIGFLAARAHSSTSDSAATAVGSVTGAPTTASGPTGSLGNGSTKSAADEALAAPPAAANEPTAAAASTSEGGGASAAGSAADSATARPYLGAAGSVDELTARIQATFDPTTSLPPTASRSADTPITSRCPAPPPPDGGVLRFSGTALLAGRPVAVFAFSSSPMSDALTVAVLDATSCAPA